MNQIIYTVPNISCEHCVHTIKMELGELPGVKTVEADAETKKVTITYEPPATPEIIEGALAEINYPVQK
jgi:copper chaperone CopZ